MDRAIGPACECVLDHRLRTLGTKRTNDHFALALGFFDPQRFLKRVTVGLIRLLSDVGLVDPFFIARDTKDGILVRDLFH